LLGRRNFKGQAVAFATKNASSGVRKAFSGRAPPSAKEFFKEGLTLPDIEVQYTC
jgi:hypothetical protein